MANIKHAQLSGQPKFNPLIFGLFVLCLPILFGIIVAGTLYITGYILYPLLRAIWGTEEPNYDHVEPVRRGEFKFTGVTPALDLAGLGTGDDLWDNVEMTGVDDALEEDAMDCSLDAGWVYYSPEALMLYFGPTESEDGED